MFFLLQIKCKVFDFIKTPACSEVLLKQTAGKNFRPAVAQFFSKKN